MIWESYYWKRELIGLRGSILAWRGQVASENESLSLEATFQIESSLFFSALSIRRLLESGKLRSAWRKKNITLRSFPANKQSSEMPIIVTSHIEEEDFDFNSVVKKSLPLHKICSEIIHSSALGYATDGKGDLEAVWISSEFNRSKRLLCLSIDLWLSLLEEIASDSVSSARWWIDPDTGEPKSELT